MTTYYVRGTSGVDTNSGVDWANAKKTIAGALAIPAVSGDIIYVAHDETVSIGTTSTITLINGWVAIISVDRNNSNAWTYGASETTTSGATTIAGVSTSSAFIYGMRFAATTTGNQGGEALNIFSTNSVSLGTLEMWSCQTDFASTSSISGHVSIGGANQSASRAPTVIMKDHSFVLGSHTGSTGMIRFGQAKIRIINPTFTYFGASKPTVLFAMRDDDAVATDAYVTGDLSGYNTTSGVLFSASVFSGGRVVFDGCKYDSAVSTISGTFPTNAGEAIFRNCDNGDTINTFEYHNRLGSLYETGSIYAASGASFNSTPIGWQVVTTAACDEANPFILPFLARWNTSTSSQTASVELIRDNATDLHNRNLWMDVKYISSASFPTHAVATNRNSNPFTGSTTDHSNPSTSWTGTGGFANANKQVLERTFTAAEAGVVEATISVAVTSQTMYFDPVVRLGGAAGGGTIWNRDSAYELPVQSGGGGGSGPLFAGII